ncbi:DUF6158 family protein [Solwaraspora sp. WMMB335]|uniref:DUF6158 family protein n=1 Tax=Solwaraspora sp. WMMB335 TaxID=3404118 RepID=UPI003B955ADA
MTDSARYGDYTPAAAGTPFEPRPGQVPVGGDGDAGDAGGAGGGPETGIDPIALTDDDLLREMGSLHRTRLDTLRHGTDAALANHLHRTADLETEYLTRNPGREVDPARLREGR